jgi:hypothetical protein
VEQGDEGRVSRGNRETFLKPHYRDHNGWHVSIQAAMQTVAFSIADGLPNSNMCSPKGKNSDLLIHT